MQRFSSFITMVGHGGMQADMVLEKELKVLHLLNNRKWSKTLDGVLSICETSKSSSIVTHFQQKDHTFPNKATPPVSVTPIRDHSSNHHPGL